ncbi:hypothetical protein UFOVP1313_60 [uncultured Caudovirales phage]|uniref:Uncharacterized protein n=1 Tax=uncultured Caudovirales phage TaxID=2100421 RepID=A0A6J5RLH1_9CAUD|nr:hypothetical protein UFOVP1313_60 [uncultured Caudovirales phage]
MGVGFGLRPSLLTLRPTATYEWAHFRTPTYQLTHLLNEGLTNALTYLLTYSLTHCYWSSFDFTTCRALQPDIRAAEAALDLASSLAWRSGLPRPVVVAPRPVRADLRADLPMRACLAFCSDCCCSVRAASLRSTSVSSTWLALIGLVIGVL